MFDLTILENNQLHNSTHWYISVDIVESREKATKYACTDNPNITFWLPNCAITKKGDKIKKWFKFNPADIRRIQAYIKTFEISNGFIQASGYLI